MSQRAFKDPLYAEFARIGHAVSSPRRIELLDLLAQAPGTVEALARQIGTPVKNTSAHLRVLRHARLVETQRDGTHVHYRVADPAVVDFVKTLQTLAHRRLAEVEQVAAMYVTRRDELQPVSAKELRRLLRDGNVTVLDVRPRAEFESAHIPGAISIPVAELQQRLHEVPKRKEVIAYCRGPYCVYSVEAVTLLRRSGYRARRSDEGVPDWRAHGYPVAAVQE